MSHGRIERKTQFLTSQLFGNGQGEVVVFFVASLLVRRYRIVDEGVDALTEQEGLQGITMGCENRKDMIDVASLPHENR